MITKFHNSLENDVESYLEKSLNSFFKELDIVCLQNDVNDFQEWFTERTFLSLYINGQIRNTSIENVSAIQEYSVNDGDSSGRCDALLTVNKTLFLIESKCQKYPSKIEDSHWDMDGWNNYDANVLKQLNWYFDTDTSFYLGTRYEKVYLQTIIFKIINNDKIKHFGSVEQKMNIQGVGLEDRSWYYGCYYPKAIQDINPENIGIEVYGSVLKKK